MGHELREFSLARLAHSPKEHRQNGKDSVWASGNGLTLIGWLDEWVDVNGQWQQPMILRDENRQLLHVVVETGRLVL